MIVQRDQIIKKLAEFCEKYPTRGKAAKALKVTPAQLSQTLNKKNNQIPERILKRLGFKSELVYLTIAPKKTNKRAKAPKKTITRVPAGVQRAAMKDLTAVEVVRPIPPELIKDPRPAHIAHGQRLQEQKEWHEVIDITK